MLGTGVIVLIDQVWLAADPNPEPLPAAVRVISMTGIALPWLLWCFAPALAGIPGLAWLNDRRIFRLEFEASGVTLHDESSRTVRWDDVSRVVVMEGSIPTAYLVLADGSRLAIPGELVQGTRADGSRTTLLDEIARYRPRLVTASAHRHRARLIGLTIVAIALFLTIPAIVLLATRQ